MIGIRKETLAFAGQSISLVDVGNEAILAFERKCEAERVFIMVNLSEQNQVVSKEKLPLWLSMPKDIFSSRSIPAGDLALGPFVFFWLKDSLGSW